MCAVHSASTSATIPADAATLCAPRSVIRTSRARPSAGSGTRSTYPARSSWSTRKPAVCLVIPACSARSVTRLPSVGDPLEHPRLRGGQVVEAELGEPGEHPGLHRAVRQEQQHAGVHGSGVGHTLDDSTRG